MNCKLMWYEPVYPKLLLTITAVAVVSACGGNASKLETRERFAGLVGFEHYECDILKSSRIYKYRLVLRKDYGDREKIALDSGGDMELQPILDAELIRPDGSRHENVRYVSTIRNDGAADLYGAGPAGYFNADKRVIRLTDKDGPILGDGEGRCSYVRPSDARGW